MTIASRPGLPPTLASAFAVKGYDALTEVQEAMLAPELQGKDLLVSAKTGSGKTVAFGVAMSEDLLQGAEQLPRATAPLALVVAPTRELAMQVAQEFQWLYGEAGGQVATCVGGMAMRDERRALSRGAHIVVGTPGRLVDHITRGTLNLAKLRVVVLDEADEMLNLGFREELEAILQVCPQERRTLMFSATVGGGIGKLAGRYQNDALRISAGGPARQHDDIAYRAFVTAQYDVERAIINTLRFYEAENAIVFCATRAAVARLTSRLANRGLSVVSLSGELSQKERTNALQAMRDGRARVCVATDVAARGIDLPGLELVIHADLPKDREGLLHRSGRTGRAGRKGTSVLIVPPKARRRIESLLANAKVESEWTTPPDADAVTARDDERLLSDPALTDDLEITDLARAIAEAHSPERLAAALIQIHKRGRSAPEELSEVLPVEAPRERRPRKDIDDGVWVILSVGRSNRAEPRWLLPMLCKSGPLNKSAIGAIRVREDETYVQLDAEGAAEFLSRVGKDCHLEDGIDVRHAEGPPPPESAPAKPPRKSSRSAATKPARKTPRKGPSKNQFSKQGKPRSKPTDKRSSKPGAADAHDNAAASEKPSTKKPKQGSKKPAGKPFKKAAGGSPGRSTDKPGGEKPAGKKPPGKPAARAHKADADGLKLKRKPKATGKTKGKPAPARPKKRPRS